MKKTRRRQRIAPVLAATAVAILALAASAQGASIWTPVASGTAGTISAIATPKPGEVIYTTTAGEIHYLTVSGSFAKAATAPVAFDDVAMSPNGANGIAVGEAGQIYRTTNSGAAWSALAKPPEFGACPSTTTGTLSDNLFSVDFADANTVYVTGANDDVLKSTDAGATFNEVNKHSGGCLIQNTIGDTAWREPSIGYLLSDNFGAFYRTTDGLSGSVGGTAKVGNAVNGSEGGDRLALDADDPTRMWATSPCVGISCFQLTVNGGANWKAPTLTDGSTTTSLLDIASGVGTNVIAVGAGGAIYTTLDGVAFTREPAPAPNETTTWESVAFQPGSATAWAGGTNGALVMTAQANVQPAPPAAGPPPAPPASGQPSAPSTPVPIERALKCTVPKLAGKSLKVAARRLKAAHCALGKVTKKKGATAKDGEVTKASRKPGKTLPAGTKIKVILAP